MWELIRDTVTTLIGVLAGAYFAIRAQRKDFLNQIKNSARIDIIKSFNNYYMWLTNAKQLALNSWDILYTSGRSQDEIYRINEECKINRSEFLKIVDQDEAKEWITILEEYKLLFKELNEKEAKLIDNHNKIVSMLKSYVNNPNNRIDESLIFIQQDLINETKIDLQNSFFKNLLR